MKTEHPDDLIKDEKHQVIEHIETVPHDASSTEGGIGPVEYTPGTAEETALVRKMDIRLFPILWLMYIFNYIDRTNIGVSETVSKSHLRLVDPCFTCGFEECKNWRNGTRPATVFIRLFPRLVYFLRRLPAQRDPIQHASHSLEAKSLSPRLDVCVGRHVGGCQRDSQSRWTGRL